MWYLDIFGRAWKLWGIQPLNYGLRQVFPPHRWVAWSWLRRNLGQRVLMEVQKNLKKMIVWGLLRFLLFRAISEGSNPTNLSMFTMFIRIARRNNLYCSFDSFQSVDERWRFQLSTVWNLTPAIARSHHGWRIACRKQNAAEGADNN